MYRIDDYNKASKQLFEKIFGLDIFVLFDKVPHKAMNPGILDIDSSHAGPNINERFSEEWIEHSKERGWTPFDMFIGVLFEYGLQQCKDHDLHEVNKMYELMYGVVYDRPIKEEEEINKKNDEFEKNRRDFSEYMTTSKDLVKRLFGFKLYNRIKNLDVVPFVWDGIDITTSSILATTPGIKERFEENWVKYANERNRTSLDIFLQSVFHYGYQYGMDKFVEPKRKSIMVLRDKAFSKQKQ